MSRTRVGYHHVPDPQQALLVRAALGGDGAADAWRAWCDATAHSSEFLDEASLQLFAVLKLRDGHTVAALPEHPVMRRWWDAMAPLMEVEPGNRPKEWTLRQVFHLE